MRSARSWPSAVVDTNLAVSGLVFPGGPPRALIRAFLAQTFTLITSTQARAEYRQVLARPKFTVKYGLAPSEAAAFLKQVDESAPPVTPLAHLPLSVRDPKDDPILAAALGGDADYLVTGDQDLLVLAGDPRLGALRIVTAAEFLAVLADEEGS